MMVFEKLPFSFDINKLQDYLHNTVLTIGEPVCPIEPGFGGWSITSDTGRWQDGWRNPGERINIPETFDKPTELYTGYMSEILNDLTEKGFNPTKVRISVLPPHGVSSIHRDYPPSVWKARLHIPILTNEQCCHIIYNKDLSESVEYHMKADGSAYMFWVNLRHKYQNLSDSKRYHVVIDVTDTKGITENFKCIMQ